MHGKQSKIDKLFSCFREPTKEQNVPGALPMDCFAYQGQITELQSKLDDAVYKLEKGTAFARSLVSEATASMEKRMVTFDEKLRIK